MRDVPMRRALVIAAVLVAPAPAVAQDPASDGPEFDISRWRDLGVGRFETYRVGETERLRDVLEAGTVLADTPVLVTETAAGPLAFVTDQMSFHHIAQGEAAGQPWMVSF